MGEINGDSRAELESRIAELEGALARIADPVYIPGHCKYRKMYERWRKLACERIDIARDALKGGDDG